MKKQEPFRRIRDAAAVDAAKAVAAASRLAGHQGTSITGKAALSLSPTVLADLAGQVKGKTFAVCGTNGKTTVNNLLCAMLEAEGKKVVCNRLGANMLPGVTGAFVDMAGHTGKLEADYACIEVDEASAQHVFGAIRPDYMILTNLFRDQLDRYGEIDITIELLKKAIRMVPEMKLIINADDPLSVYLAMETGNPCVYYGIQEPVHKCETDTKENNTGENNKKENNKERPKKELTHEVREGQFCKKCGAALVYEYYHYGQMGKYRCSACDFTRPEPRYAATGISTENGIRFLVEGLSVESDLRGLYSVYNLLAVWSALHEEGNQILYTNRFNEVLRTYHTQFGRNETFCIEGRRVILNLAKNPAGFNQNIESMLEDGDPKLLIIVINDNEQDGTDVSWLWDVDFDRIRDESVLSVTVSGIRALDMCLRLKYVGIEAEIAETPEKAVQENLAKLDAAKFRDEKTKTESTVDSKESLYVLVNYTALFAAHQYLENLEKRSDGHEDGTATGQRGGRKS